MQFYFNQLPGYCFHTDLNLSLIEASEDFLELFGLESYENVKVELTSEFSSNLDPRNIKKSVVGIKVNNVKQDFVLYSKLIVEKEREEILFFGDFIGLEEEVEKQILIEQAVSISEKQSKFYKRISERINHEINNKVDIIQGNLLKAMKMKNYEETIPVIRKDVLEISNLFKNNLFMFEVSDKPVELENLVTFILESFTETLRLHQIGLDLNIESGQSAVSGRLGMILKELFSNSIESLKLIEKKREIIFSSKREENNLRILFMDTGRGVDIKFEDQIFDPFYTSKISDNNLGLGLFNARNSIELVGGEITAITSGKYFTINILIPILEAKE